MQINWYLVGICVLIWLAGYCFGYSVGKTSGLKEGAFFILNKMEDIVDKLPQKGCASNGKEKD